MGQIMKVVRVTVLTGPLMMTLMSLGIVAVLWFGGVQVVQGGMQLGQIIAFISYLTNTLMSLMMVSMLILQISRAAASADRIQQVLESEPDVQDKPGALHEFAAQGRVAFEHVTFSYDGGSGDPVLRDNQLRCRARTNRRAAGFYRGGQDHTGEPHSALL